MSRHLAWSNRLCLQASVVSDDLFEGVTVVDILSQSPMNASLKPRIAVGSPFQGSIARESELLACRGSPNNCLLFYAAFGESLEIRTAKAKSEAQVLLW